MDTGEFHFSKRKKNNIIDVKNNYCYPGELNYKRYICMG